MSYAALTPNDEIEMLRVIGVDSIDDLFADISPELRAKATPGIGKGRGEMPLRRAMSEIAARNRHTGESSSFLGGGSYNHYIPAIIPVLASRGEWMTAYTPYQAEVSQGTLQVIYEFQTMLCQLTQMEMANASLYDGATAVAEAIIMAQAVSKKSRIVWSSGLSPFYRRVSQTYLQGLNTPIDTIETGDRALTVDDLTDKIGSDVAAVVIQQPDFYGRVQEMQVLADAVHAAGALLIVVFNPISLGILPPPGSYGADIAVGEGQPLGISSSFGGPGVGLFCCRKKYARFAPGRLVGQTTDEQGRDGFTLTLQTREQHIRREKATSNICTNQALCALMASIYLSSLGPRGLQDVATQSHHKAHYAAQVLAAIDGCEIVDSGAWFHEFVVQLPLPASQVNAQLQERDIIGGLDLGRVDEKRAHQMLFCCTEMNTREEIDALAQALKEIVESASR